MGARPSAREKRCGDQKSLGRMTEEGIQLRAKLLTRPSLLTFEFQEKAGGVRFERRLCRGGLHQVVNSFASRDRELGYLVFRHPSLVRSRGAHLVVVEGKGRTNAVRYF